MKLVRLISAIPLLFSLSLGLFALQWEYEGFGGRRYSYQYSTGSNVPSEFYWSRLQYTSSYATELFLRVIGDPDRAGVPFHQDPFMFLRVTKFSGYMFYFARL